MKLPIKGIRETVPSLTSYMGKKTILVLTHKLSLSGFTYLNSSFLEKYPFLEKMSQENGKTKHTYKPENMLLNN